MKRRLVVVAAALAMALAAEAFDKQSCRIAERFKDHPIFNTRHCSVNFGFLGRRGYFSKPETLAEVAKIKAAGANWVTLNTHFCQESFYSRKLFLDFERSSGEAELTDIVRELHRQGLHVLLKPCLMLLDGAWMGRVAFPDDDQLIQGVHNSYWADWFAALQGCLEYYAQFAERNGVEAMIIGAEYNGTTYQDERWRETIRKVREHYSGPLTYECADYEVANDDYTDVDAAKVKRLGWLEDLDFLALSTYPAGAPACPREQRAALGPVSLETMKKHLAKRRTFVTALSAAYGRLPVLYTEIGTRSARGNVCEPWNFMTESPCDAAEQANYMEAVFAAHDDLPCWLGLSWWKWDESQKNRPHYNADPSKDRGFIIDGKPACGVLRKWCRSAAGATDAAIAVWGYVLDKTPTACPFVIGKTEFSLERAAAEFGVRKAMYMNSCFNRDYIVKEFPDWDRECFANCIDNRLCDVQLEKLRGMDEVWCATTHGKKLESAVRIAEMSLRFPNIVGVNFDDFNNGNPATKISVAELRALKAAMHAINPKLKVSVVSYVKDANESDFDLTPFRGEIDHVSRWKWVTETNYWTKANFRADIAELRRQVGPGVTVVQGLYLHDFASDMKCPNPLPFDYFKLSVSTALDAVADGTLDGVILPQVAWYSAPTHRRHYEWLREKIRTFRKQEKVK